MENLSFSGGVVVGFVAAVLIASLWWTYGWATGGSSTDVAYSQIASIRTHGVPEGPDDALTYSQTPSERSLPIDLIQSHIPQPLPATLDQGIGCDHGGELIVTLTDGHSITYGPCAWPWQISELWGAMTELPTIIGTDPKARHLRSEIASACKAHPYLCR